MLKFLYTYISLIELPLDPHNLSSRPCSICFLVLCCIQRKSSNSYLLSTSFFFCLFSLILFFAGSHCKSHRCYFGILFPQICVHRLFILGVVISILSLVEPTVLFLFFSSSYSLFCLIL